MKAPVRKLACRLAGQTLLIAPAILAENQYASMDLVFPRAVIMEALERLSSHLRTHALFLIVQIPHAIGDRKCTGLVLRFAV